MIVKCNCEKVAIAIPEPAELPELQICHCVDCRKFTGGLGAYLIHVPSSVVQVQGEVREHSLFGYGGRKARRFWCPSCGCSLFDRNQQGDYYVMAGLLPPGSVPRPGNEIWCKDMEKWEHLYVPGNSHQTQAE